MKVLVCIDGSDHSQKVLEKAAIISDGCNVNDVAIIYVYDGKLDFSSLPRGGSSITKEDMDRFHKVNEEHKNESKKILSDALSFLKEKNINARTIFKEGRPADTIVDEGCNEGFDMIVIGHRGYTGLKKLLLGSVSNAVVQQAKDCIVVVVK